MIKKALATFLAAMLFALPAMAEQATGCNLGMVNANGSFPSAGGTLGSSATLCWSSNDCISAGTADGYLKLVDSAGTHGLQFRHTTDGILAIYERTGATALTQLQIGDGTLSVPSYSFASTTGLGMYRVSSTILGFASSGAVQLQIGASDIVLRNAQDILWNGRSGLINPADGTIRWFNTSATTFVEEWGGATSSFPAMQFDGTRAKITTGDLPANGISSLNTKRQPLAKTTNYTIVADDSGVLFTNTGASGAVALTLPSPATIGLCFMFAATAAQNLKIITPSGKIYQGASAGASGGYICSSTLISSVTLCSVDGTNYAVDAAAVGTWTTDSGC